MNTHRFQDKVVLVTGGNSGIGRAASLAFAREGAKVVIAARREELGRSVVKEIKENGGEAAFVKTDVMNPDDIEKLFETVSRQFTRLDCAFNNAGIGSHMRRLVHSTMEEWDAVMKTNLRGVWLCMKYEIPIMVKQGGGAIVNNSSIAGLCTEDGISIYSASKHAVLGLTRGAALDYARRNIRINAVCPGFIHTPMVEESCSKGPQVKDMMLNSIPMRRLGRPEEIASAVLWMCSDAASFMTGKEMVIGGGQAIRS